MTPVLFFSPGACSLGSIIALEWLNQPYRLCKLDDTTRHSDAYRKLNPLMQVPTFKSAQGVLSESAAILNHIAFLGITRKIGFKQGTFEFDHLNQLISFMTTGLHPIYGHVMHPERFVDGEEAQEELKTKTIEELVPAKLKVLEQILERHQWLAGTAPTVADAYYFWIATKAGGFINIDKDFPKTAAFIEKMKQDPAVKFALAIEKGETPKTAGGYKGTFELAQLV